VQGRVSGQTSGKEPGETTGQRRGPRPRRAAVQPPTRLPEEGAHGVVRGWEAGSSLQEAEEATLRATEALRARREAAQGNDPGTEPERAPLLEQRPAGESEAAWGDPDGAAEDAARAAWIKSQRPPHWG
jgi:hypothetical protein